MVDVFFEKFLELFRLLELIKLSCRINKFYGSSVALRTPQLQLSVCTSDMIRNYIFSRINKRTNE